MRRRAPHCLAAFENAGQRIVVASRYGVRFVIVTAGAADAEAEDAAADDVDLIGDDIHLEIVVHRLRGLGAECEQSGGDELAVALLRRIGRKQVTRELLSDEAVIRQVFVEGTDHIVAIAPCMREAGIAAEAIIAVRFGIARHIHPMTAPFFAEVGTAEQRIDVVGQV